MNQKKARRIRLETVFDETLEPVFLIDQRKNFRFVNQALTRLTGWSVEEIVGQPALFQTEPDSKKVESVTSVLSPPPEVYEGQQVSYPIFLPSQTGQPLPFLIHFYPLGNDQKDTGFILGIITEIKKDKHVSGPPAFELHAELTALRSRLRHRFHIDHVLGTTRDMIRVINQLKIAATQISSVHLTGEPGTGKKHVARTIHYTGPTGSYAFVPYDCKKIQPRDLRASLKRVLDSYRSEDKKENLAFVMNLPGTILLENLEDLTRENQEWILENFSQLPDSNEEDYLRLITSSRKSLEELKQESVLLPDFYYFISTLEITLPPLRTRKEDLPVLCQYFLEMQNSSDKNQFSGFDKDVLNLFQEYNWPGNLSELKKVIEESVSKCTNPRINLNSLPFRFHAGYESQSIGPILKQEIKPLDELLRETEVEQILLALDEAKLNKAEAARLLGITRPRLYRRMEQLGLLDDSAEKE